MVIKQTSLRVSAGPAGEGRLSTAVALRLSVGPHALGSDVLLAPLSGISDVPFRHLARRFGAGLVYSEMVASGELLRGSRESLRRAMADGRGLHAVQLAGRSPDEMGRAARLLSDAGADIIDINFGCPAKKVVGGLSGSALMREPALALALAIVEATVAGAGRVPVTLKMRLGWDRATMNAPMLAAKAADAGVQLVTIHGRTRQQFYEGTADWAAIAAVKRAVSIPVVANGDLVEASQESRMRAASGCDGVMIGRGACGRPWFPGLLAGATTIGDLRRIRLCDFACEHLDMMLVHYGASAGLRQARKHLGWYLDRASGALGSGPGPRSAILRNDSPAAVGVELRRVLAGITAYEIERIPPVARQEAA